MTYKKKWFLEEQVLGKIVYNTGHLILRPGAKIKWPSLASPGRKKEQRGHRFYEADFAPYWEMRHLATPTLLLPSSAFLYNVAGARPRNSERRFSDVLFTLTPQKASSDPYPGPPNLPGRRPPQPAAGYGYTTFLFLLVFKRPGRDKYQRQQKRNRGGGRKKKKSFFSC